MDDKPKRKHSVSRILQKLKPKRKKSNEQQQLGAGFMSLRTSSTNLSSASENEDGSSILRRRSLFEKRSISSSILVTEVTERFITLATYNCVMFHRNGAVQGRLYLTDAFIVFDSKTLVMTVRIKMDWEEVLDVRLRPVDNELVIVVNGVRERYSFGRFLLNTCTTIQDVAKEITKIWNGASSKILIDESALIQGPKWPCGCFTHLEKSLLTNQLVSALPFEIFEKLFIQTSWISTFKEFQDIDEHLISTSEFLLDNKEGDERIVAHVIKNKNGSLKKMQQTQKIQVFTPNIISVTSDFKEDNDQSLVATQRWCFVRETSSALTYASRVFLSCQGGCEFVHATYAKFVKEEFKERFKYLHYVDKREDNYLSDELRVFWGLLVRTRLSMFEKNIWLFILVIGFYFFGSLLPFLFNRIFYTEPPLFLLPLSSNNLDEMSSLAKEEINSQLKSLEQLLS